MKQDLRQSLRLLAAAVAATLALALLPPSTAWAGSAIGLLTVSGYGGAAAMLHLFLFPLRLRHLMPGGAVPLAGHRQIALLGIGLTLLHSLGYLLIEPASLGEISLEEPLYMQCGLLALILMAVVTVSSRLPWRQRQAQTAVGFRAPHLLGSAALLTLIALHAGGAGLWLDRPWKAALWSALSGLAIAGLLRIGHHRRGRP